MRGLRIGLRLFHVKQRPDLCRLRGQFLRARTPLGQQPHGLAVWKTGRTTPAICPAARRPAPKSPRRESPAHSPAAIPAPGIAPARANRTPVAETPPAACAIRPVHHVAAAGRWRSPARATRPRCPDRASAPSSTWNMVEQLQAVSHMPLPHPRQAGIGNQVLPRVLLSQHRQRNRSSRSIAATSQRSAQKARAAASFQFHHAHSVAAHAPAAPPAPPE